MNIDCRRFLAVAGLFGLPVKPALARSAPELSRIVVGFPAGSTPDVLARKVADRMAGKYSRSVMVENKAGASGQLAAVSVKTAVRSS